MRVEDFSSIVERFLSSLGKCIEGNNRKKNT